jgi:hypothetical protein
MQLKNIEGIDNQFARYYSYTIGVRIGDKEKQVEYRSNPDGPKEPAAFEKVQAALVKIANENTIENKGDGGESDKPKKPTEFKLEYEATRDTEWSTNPGSPQPPTKGSVKKGTHVFLSHEPSDLANWQSAWVEDRIRWIRPSDFKKVG